MISLSVDYVNAGEVLRGSEGCRGDHTTDRYRTEAQNVQKLLQQLFDQSIDVDLRGIEESYPVVFLCAQD